MIDEKILQDLRACVKDPKWPLDLDEYPKDIHVNCLAFALGLTVSDPKEMIYDYVGHISGIAQYNIETGIMRDCNALGIACRKISSEDECQPNEHLICAYGFVLDQYASYTARLYHVVRLQKNGRWAHKDKYDGPFEEISDWLSFHREYSKAGAHLFAIRRAEP